MKNLILTSILIASLSAKGQVHTTTTTNADSTTSGSYGVQLTKPTESVTSQINFEYPDGISPVPVVYNKGANNKTYILVVNESKPDLSEYKLDIFAGNKKLSKATVLVTLSLTSSNKLQLSNGTYRYSNQAAPERQNYRFAGTVKLGSTDVEITEGWVQINSWDKHIVINYNLTLKNGVKTTGKYDSEYQSEDRSEKQPVNSGIKINQQ